MDKTTKKASRQAFLNNPYKNPGAINAFLGGVDLVMNPWDAYDRPPKEDKMSAGRRIASHWTEVGRYLKVAMVKADAQVRCLEQMFDPEEIDLLKKIAAAQGNHRGRTLNLSAEEINCARNIIATGRIEFIKDIFGKENINKIKEVTNVKEIKRKEPEEGAHSF